tara:strand:+ start:2633 stop:4270 length:1638 start_codon:yes stop_codon:yes gene_type:complete
MDKEMTAGRPNILVIVADDLGYSDLGVFGSEIATPNLNKLAERGVVFTQFYATPACSTTRASLLTGRDNHEVGLGAMAEAPMPEYAGNVRFSGGFTRGAVTVAERLRAAGYATMMSGKWHLGLEDYQNPAAMGFDKSFALLRGAHNHFGMDQSGRYAANGESSLYTHDGDVARFPEGAYSSDYFTERMIEFVSENARSKKPFFAYLAFTAPHWPVQAPDEVIAKYRGRYDKGPETIRRERENRMREKGILSDTATTSPDSLTEWAGLSLKQRAASARKMEIYAAMVDRMDNNIGRLLDSLEQLSVLSNTVVIFLSDNGPDPNDFEQPISLVNARPLDVPFSNSLENLGSGTSFVGAGKDWARVSAAPFTGLKLSVHQGGIRTPAIVAGPSVLGSGRLYRGAAHVLDIVPTILEFASIEDSVNPENPTDEPQWFGKAWQPALTGAKVAIKIDDRTMNWEFYSQRAARNGPYQAQYTPQRSGGLGANIISRAKAAWQLYDIESDPGETIDISAVHPQVLSRLIAQWYDYSARVGIQTPDREKSEATR